MKLAVVTPSYFKDFERCALLCRSLDAFLDPQIEHVLIIERRDLDQFRPLVRPGRRMLVVQDMIPGWIRRTPFSNSWWLSLKSLPIRNWIMQQIVKLSIAEFVDAEGYILMDSDMFLVRPVGPDVFVRDGKLALFRIPGHYEAAKAWHRSSARLLGLPVTDFFGSNYVGQMITWRRDNLKNLVNHIEKTVKMPWVRAISGELHISEYTLYGIFSEHVVGGDAGHFWDTRPLCNGIWNGPWGSDEDIRNLFTNHGADQVASMISSKIGVPAARYIGAWADFTSQTSLSARDEQI